jgi:hypothetical protein
MKLQRLVRTGLAAFALFMVLTWSARAGDDPLAPYRITKVTQTEERATDGSVSRVELVRDSRVDVKERITETKTADASGNLKLTARTTVTQGTDGAITTVVEQAMPGIVDLVVVSKSTEVRDSSGGSHTIVETRDAQGQMVLTRQVEVEVQNGSVVTTVRVPDQNGNLYMSARTVKQP